jgi:hypothetical protein
VLVHFLSVYIQPILSQILSLLRRAIYIYSRSVLLQHTFPALTLSLSLSLSFFLSRSFQSSVGEKYIFVHRTKPLSPTPSGSPNTLFFSYSLTRTFSLSLLLTVRSEVRHEARFSRENAGEHIWIRVERDATEKRHRRNGEGTIKSER